MYALYKFCQCGNTVYFLDKMIPFWKLGKIKFPRSGEVDTTLGCNPACVPPMYSTVCIWEPAATLLMQRVGGAGVGGIRGHWWVSFKTQLME